MRGNDTIRFSDLFTDTVRTHGKFWAIKYYRKHGMQWWEVHFWLRATGV